MFFFTFFKNFRDSDEDDDGVVFNGHESDVEDVFQSDDEDEAVLNR